MESLLQTDSQSVQTSQQLRVFKEEEGKRACAIIGQSGIDTGREYEQYWIVYNDPMDRDQHKWCLLSFDCDADDGACSYTRGDSEGCGRDNRRTQGLCRERLH